MKTSRIVYCEEPGPSNTEKILRFSKERGEQLDIVHVIIATNLGTTANKAMKIFGNTKFKILAITNSKGSMMPVANLYGKYEESKKIKTHYREKGIAKYPISVPDETATDLEKKGVKVFYLPDILGISGRFRSEKDLVKTRSRLDNFLPRHLRPLDIEAGADLSLLNIVSMGFRVAVGMAAVAARNDLVPKNETVLSIAGSGWAGGGADTALVIDANPNPRLCFIREILGFPKLK